MSVKQEYVSFPSPVRDPRVMAAYAKLSGINVTDPINSIVVDLGCGFGGDILNFASMFPNSEYIGVDIDPETFKISQKIAKDCSIRNISFLEYDLSDEFQLESGKKADYVILHGVYSWVSEDIRKSLLRNIKNLLSDRGIAYVSFNQLPGWSTRETLKFEILAATKNDKTDTEKIANARSKLSEIAIFSSNEALKLEASKCNEMTDAFILLELLDRKVTATSFDDFQFSLASSGLRVIETERFTKFYTSSDSNSPFANILVTKAATIDGINREDDNIGDSLKSYYYSSNLTYENIETGNFYRPDGKVEKIDEKYWNIFSKLAEDYPSFLSYKELFNELSIVPGELLNLINNELVNISFSPLIIPIPIPEKPNVSVFCRELAKYKKWIYTRNSEYVFVDEFQSALLEYVDGTRDFDELVSALETDKVWENLSNIEIKSLLKTTMIYFHQQCVLG